MNNLFVFTIDQVSGGNAQSAYTQSAYASIDSMNGDCSMLSASMLRTRKEAAESERLICLTTGG